MFSSQLVTPLLGVTPPVGVMPLLGVTLGVGNKTTTVRFRKEIHGWAENYYVCTVKMTLNVVNMGHERTADCNVTHGTRTAIPWMKALCFFNPSTSPSAHPLCLVRSLSYVTRLPAHFLRAVATDGFTLKLMEHPVRFISALKGAGEPNADGRDKQYSVLVSTNPFQALIRTYCINTVIMFGLNLT